MYFQLKNERYQMMIVLMKLSIYLCTNLFVMIVTIEQNFQKIFSHIHFLIIFLLQINFWNLFRIQKKEIFLLDGNSKDDWSKIIQDFLELKYSTNQNLLNQKNKRDNFAGGISFVSVKNIEELFDCEYLKKTVAEINKNENLSNQNIPEETKPFLVVYINSNPKNKEYLKEGWW